MINENYKITMNTGDIIIIDDFYKFPDKIVNFAFKNEPNFITHKSIYENKVFNPGLYYDKYPEFINFFEKILKKKIYKEEWDYTVKEESNGWIQYNTHTLKPFIHTDNGGEDGTIQTNWGVVVYFTKRKAKGKILDFLKIK